MCGLHHVSRLLTSSLLLLAIGLPTASIAQAGLQQQMDTLSAATSLDRDGIKPWHMRLAFDLFDLKGKPQESGTIEEWWAGADRARVVITSPSFNETLPGDELGVQGREAYLVHLLLNEFAHPMPKVPNPDSLVSKVMSQNFGQISLSCTSLRVNSDDTAPREYCTDPSTGDLRLVFSDVIRSDALNEVNPAMNTQIAMRHTIAYMGQTAITGHIESIEPFDPDHSNMQLGPIAAPPYDASVATPPHLLTRVAPGFPPHLSGQGGFVVLHMRILANGKHGAIDNITSTGKSFTESAMDAVGRWAYAPMKRNGLATECDSTITIRFVAEGVGHDMPQVLISEFLNP